MAVKAEQTRVAVLLSGSGRTLQNLMDEARAGSLAIDIVCTITDRDCPGLERARTAGIPTYLESNDEAQHRILREHGAELVCLCGYLRLFRMTPDLDGRVLNIHPALLPKFGGKGFHGARVHRAVLESGDTVSGCTVHYCDREYDRGPILLQTEVPVTAGDTVETLAARVFEAECRTYPEAIRLWIELTSKGGGGPS